MRWVAVVLLVVAASLPATVAGDPNHLDETPLVPRACEPDPPPIDIKRPASCQRILYVFGPIAVTPGDNLILVEPVRIEKPAFPGYIVRFKPDLVYATGEVPEIADIHLHHAVWISTRFGAPPFATGEEKTIFSLPNGYGVPVAPSDVWLLNYMIHNQTPRPATVFITYELDVIPAVEAPGVRAVEPQWLNVGNRNGLNPVFNVQRRYGGTDGVCAFPKERCADFDPYGDDWTGQGRPGNGVGHVVDAKPGTVVWMGGHLHPGSKRLTVDLRRGSNVKRVFNSDARYFDPNGPVSWDMSMEVTVPDYRLRVEPGDEYILNALYETQHASWYEPMGIVVIFVAPDDASGRNPFTTTVNPDAVTITHGHLEEAGVYGGGAEQPLESDLPEIRTRMISITGFGYYPGNLGSESFGVPTVDAGQSLTWVNLDAPSAIFHSVTACALPCNGSTGISYPLANGRHDFDSLQLGFGPPFVTPAANRAHFTLDTSEFDPGPYTYFCRIHPAMRGVFKVT